MGQILAPLSNTGRVSDADGDGMDGDGVDEEVGTVEAGGCCCCLVRMSPVVSCNCWISHSAPVGWTVELLKWVSSHKGIALALTPWRKWCSGPPGILWGLHL